MTALNLHGAHAGHSVEKDTVTAVEAFPPMAALANTVLRGNGMTEQVKVINKHSTDVVVSDGADAGISRRPCFFALQQIVCPCPEAQPDRSLLVQDMQQRADVIVTEIFDSGGMGY